MVSLFVRKIVFIPLFLVCFSVNGQKYILPNENVIFSFNTQNGKFITINKDKENRYIIYRFGTKDKVEFEYPDKLKSSFTNFKYSYYLRGGGIQNAGMDCNYLYFVNGDFKYVIYDTYFSRDGKQNIGIKIIDLKSNKIIDIKGNRKTRKGMLIDFRDNKLLEIGEELFD